MGPISLSGQQIEASPLILIGLLTNAPFQNRAAGTPPFNHQLESKVAPPSVSHCHRARPPPPSIVLVRLLAAPSLSSPLTGTAGGERCWICSRLVEDLSAEGGRGVGSRGGEGNLPLPAAGRPGVGGGAGSAGEEGGGPPSSPPGDSLAPPGFR